MKAFKSYHALGTILLLCLFLCACSSTRMFETDLYFGQSKPDGTTVTENEWNHFKETQVSRIFKEGSTTIRGTGAWYDVDRDTLISEPAYVVVYFYKKSRQASKKIDSLRLLYKTNFQQQSILRVDKRVKVDF